MRRTGRSRQHRQCRFRHTAHADFTFRRFANIAHGQVQTQSHACQGMVAVQHHVGGINLGDGVDRVGRHVGGLRTFWHTIKLHAGLNPVGKQRACFKKNQLGVVVAKGVLGFQVQLGLKPDLLVDEYLFDLGQQIAATDKKFNRVGEFINQGAVGVFKSPGQADDAGVLNQHDGMINRLRVLLPLAAKRDNHDMPKNIKPDQALPLLGGLSAQAFMRKHWQKKPLLIRQAVPDASAILNRTALFAMASQEGVESRLIKQAAKGWKLSHGPFTRRQLPSPKSPAWTLLVQGVDLHCPAAHALLQQFRFVPEARLDDLMVSYASDQGGVGPHFDSYDVFLLQLHGRRRWRIGRLQNPELQANVPLKVLAHFEYEQEWVLEPGDMLYLPPRWAHDGQAIGECMTASIGFRSASKAEFAREVIKRSLDALEDEAPDLASPQDMALYRDPYQVATATPGAIPVQMQDFARTAVAEFLNDANGLHCSLGEWLSEPKPSVWFDEGCAIQKSRPLSLDARSRMLYDRHHIYINGESYRAGGSDARLLRCLADQRGLTASQVLKLSEQAWDLVKDWADAGWLHQSQAADSGDEP